MDYRLPDVENVRVVAGDDAGQSGGLSGFVGTRKMDENGVAKRS